MFAEFNSLPETSKIWIYQSDRMITDAEKAQITTDTRNFLESWTAHQLNLKAGFSMPFDAFLVIAVDEKVNGASGCSIDKKVHFIQELERKYKLNFFNRHLVAYIKKDHLFFTTIQELEKKLQTGEIQASTIVFNNLVNTMAEFKTQWQIPLQDSWHMGLFASNGH